MTTPASTPILAAICTLPVIVACALLAAPEARGDTCTANLSGCEPYRVTIGQVGPNVVATGSGEFDLPGLGLSGLDLANFPAIQPSRGGPAIQPSRGGSAGPQFALGPDFQGVDRYVAPFTGLLSETTNFGAGTVRVFASTSS